jgi:hypothetical protein
MIKTVRENNDFFINKIGKKLKDSLKKIDDDVSE